MKNYTLSALAILITIFACNNPTKNTVAANNAKTENLDSTSTQNVYQLDTLKSNLAWEGAEGLLSILKTHNGLLSLSGGEIQTNNKQIIGGSFTIPLKTLTVLDIPKEKPGNAKLVKHLLAADFFDADKYPMATFKITAAKIIANDSSLITGNLTLKNIAKSISFKAKITLTDSTITASVPKFYINRKDWGISYRTDKSFGDELIRPEIGIAINLVASKK
jgi:polyisoprenoid-binding protein YceI